MIRDAAMPAAAGSRSRRTSKMSKMLSSRAAWAAVRTPSSRKGRLEAGDECAEAAADLDEPHVRERPDGLSHRAAGHPELACQLLLGRELRPGLEFPGQNQVPQPRERVIGDAHLPPFSSDIR